MIPILAIDALPDPNSFASIGWIVVTIGAVLAIVYYAVAIWTMTRPQPPLHDQFEQIRTEARDGRAKLHKHLESAQAHIEKTIATMQTDIRDHDRKIVALETKVWGGN